jgi:hypothetical protein
MHSNIYENTFEFLRRTHTAAFEDCEEEDSEEEDSEEEDCEAWVTYQIKTPTGQA